MAKKIARKRKRRSFSNKSKRIYYKAWLRGYEDSRPRENLSATTDEYAWRKVDLSPEMHSLYKGEIAGMKAQLSDRKKGKYDK